MKAIYLITVLSLGAVTAPLLLAENASLTSVQVRKDFAKLQEFQTRCQTYYTRARSVANHYANTPGSATPAQIAEMKRSADTLLLLYRQIPVKGSARELTQYKTETLKKHRHLYNTSTASVEKAERRVGIDPNNPAASGGTAVPPAPAPAVAKEVYISKFSPSGGASYVVTVNGVNVTRSGITVPLKGKNVTIQVKYLDDERRQTRAGRNLSGNIIYDQDDDYTVKYHSQRVSASTTRSVSLEDYNWKVGRMPSTWTYNVGRTGPSVVKDNVITLSTDRVGTANLTVGGKLKWKHVSNRNGRTFTNYKGGAVKPLTLAISVAPKL